MTAEEAISVSRLAKKVDDLADDMITKDLLVSEIRRIDTAIEAHIKYTQGAALAETSRINDILKANAEALQQANAEANERNVAAVTQAERVANTLRELVETTRSAASKSLTEVINPIINRLNEIEQKQYENKGKEAVNDPMMIKLVERMEDVATAMAKGEGKGAGATALWGYIIGAIGVLSAILAIASRFAP